MHAVSLAVLLMFAQRPDVNAPPTPTLIVNGSAQVLAAPDEATVRLGIVRQSPNAQTAQEQANAVAQEILAAFGKLGVPANQIQTARTFVSPVYAPRGPESREAPRIVAYTATNTVSIRLSNLTLIGSAIDAGLKAGANQLEGVQFGLRNDLPSRRSAEAGSTGSAQQSSSHGGCVAGKTRGSARSVRKRSIHLTLRRGCAGVPACRFRRDACFARSNSGSSERDDSLPNIS